MSASSLSRSPGPAGRPDASGLAPDAPGWRSGWRVVSGRCPPFQQRAEDGQLAREGIADLDPVGALARLRTRGRRSGSKAAERGLIRGERGLGGGEPRAQRDPPPLDDLRLRAAPRVLASRPPVLGVHGALKPLAFNLCLAERGHRRASPPSRST